MNERFTITASSLGSYFGVGFNDPDVQLAIDMGEIPNEFDEDSQYRMDIGNILEDASLNCLERRLGIMITNRNTKVVEAMDGMLRLKLDGETIYDGELTVVENKVSNAKSYVFTKNKGYHLQCQAYMLVTEYKQAILGGLYRGEVVYEVIKRDNEVIEDIKEMVTKVYGILNGLLSKDDFPWHLVEKYTKSGKPETSDEFDVVEDEELVVELLDIKSTKSALETREKAINAYFKSKYSNLNYTGSNYKLAISKFVREGGLDTARIELEHPDIDLSTYREAPIEITTVRVTAKK